MDSASKWLVGSSRSSTSGCLRSSLQRATLRRSPPDSSDIFCVSGGQRSASIAILNFVSNSQASRASILSWTSAWRLINASIFSVEFKISSSINFAFISSNSASVSTISCVPSSTISLTVFDSSRSGS